MKLIIAKSPWEVFGDPLGHTLARIVAAGYDAVEVHLDGRPEPVPELKRMLRDSGLPVIVQINSGGGGSADAHALELERIYEHALQFEPDFCNSHTGRDWLSYDDNRRVFDRAAQLVARHRVPICHETHRGRALYSLPVAVRFLQAMPEIRLTADLSHWFCVHESDLGDQQAALSIVLDRVDHIHARVGFGEGPQVSDPRNPGHAAALARSLALWSEIVRRAAARGMTRFTLTPEFGPVPYMPLAGRDDRPVADAWEINAWMRDLLRERLLTRRRHSNEDENAVNQTHTA